MKRKKIKLMSTFILALLFMTGCGMSVKNEDQILDDVENYESEINFFGFSDAVTIEKRQTNKDNKEDTVYVTLYGSNDYAYQEYDCVLYYNYYDKGGWILDNLEVEDFNVTDLRARDDEEILETFNNNPEDYVQGTFDTINFTHVETVDFDESTFYSFKRVWFEAKCEKALKYTAKNAYVLTEIYNPQTGEWEDQYSGISFLTQSIHNVENLIWLGSPNTYGTYSYMRLKEEPEGNYYDSTMILYLYRRYFNSENEEITEAVGQMDDSGYVTDGTLTHIDLLNGTAEYRDINTYDDVHMAYFDFDNATIYIPDFDVTYSIYNTNGEEPPFTYKDFGGENESQLEERKALDF